MDTYNYWTFRVDDDSEMSPSTIISLDEYMTQPIMAHIKGSTEQCSAYGYTGTVSLPYLELNGPDKNVDVFSAISVGGTDFYTNHGNVSNMGERNYFMRMLSNDSYRNAKKKFLYDVNSSDLVETFNLST